VFDTPNNRSSDKPLITVITVVFNGGKHFEETIQSLLEVDDNFNYIVIDGGSTDGTVDIIKKYEDKINYWISEKDNGIYDAMNKGWAAATDNNFILFLGAGDRIVSLPPNMAAFSARDVIYGRVDLGNGLVFKPNVGWKLRLSNTIHHQAMLVPKAIHPAPPFDPELKVYADFDFNQRLVKLGANFVYSDKFIGTASPGGISTDFDYCENFRVVKKNYGLLSALFSLLFVPTLKIYKAIQKHVRV